MYICIRTYVYVHAYHTIQIHRRVGELRNLPQCTLHTTITRDNYRVQIIELPMNSNNEWHVTVQCQIWTRNREPQLHVVCRCVSLSNVRTHTYDGERNRGQATLLLLLVLLCTEGSQ